MAEPAEPRWTVEQANLELQAVTWIPDTNSDYRDELEIAQARYDRMWRKKEGVVTKPAEPRRTR